MMAVVDQRHEALLLANLARTRGAEVRRELQDTSRSRSDRMAWAARVLEDEPDRVAIMQVHRFLEMLPRIGEKRVRGLLTAAGSAGVPIWPLRRVASLTERERLALAREIRAEAARLSARHARSET